MWYTENASNTDELASFVFSDASSKCNLDNSAWLLDWTTHLVLNFSSAPGFPNDLHFMNFWHFSNVNIFIEFLKLYNTGTLSQSISIYTSHTLMISFKLQFLHIHIFLTFTFYIRRVIHAITMFYTEARDVWRIYSYEELYSFLYDVAIVHKIKRTV